MSGRWCGLSIASSTGSWLTFGMASKRISVGRHELSVQGGEVVDERNPMLGKTERTIIPLNAISSIDVTKEQNLKALIGAVVAGLFGFVALVEGATTAGLVLILGAGLLALWWAATRSYYLIVQSATASIEVEGKASAQETLESFADVVREQRQDEARATPR